MSNQPAKAVVATRPPSLGPVLLTVLLDLVGFGIVIPLASFYSEEFGASEQAAIALLGMYSLAQFFFAPLWGRLSDRVGRRPVMLVSIAATAVCLFAFASAGPLAGLGWGALGGADTFTVQRTALVLLFVFRFLHGAFAANISTAFAYVADVTRPEDRARGMGLIGAAFGVGFTIGPVIGGVLSPFGHAVPMYVAAGLSAVNLVWAMFALPESHRPGAPSKRVGRTLDPRRLWSGLVHPRAGAAVALTFVSTLAFAMMEVAFPLAAEHRWGMTGLDVGYVFGVIGIVGIVIQGGLTRRLVAHYGERNLVGVGFALNAIGLLGLVLAPNRPLLYVTMVLLAIGTSLATPSLSALVSRAAEAEEQGAVLGTNQSMSALARAVAPWIALTAYTLARWAPFLLACLLMSAAIFAVGTAARRALQRQL